ncbi:amino acid ABC transporter substrate-binding protein [Marinomonas transparens]|uniref:Amino acid ABC transporter substrate-binding protein n=1 Tax=Marinomonas transparens TaxID=2795388 RepID=A0A934N160_9GAMM|nr:amino acid ABC transporter substrate-binding protein [Marinomonas transparens]MBJ7537427.1 amino acid ABC transporter substrate-binding protein [Marinomonas transparens]
MPVHNTSRPKFRPIINLLLLLSFFSSISSASTLSTVIDRGDLNCGVYPDDPGRSAISVKGHWRGFYVDFCKAVAAAVLKNPNYINYVEVKAKTRFTSLEDKVVDVVMYSSTWTLGRENKYHIRFPAIYLFDGQGFVVRKSSNIKSLADLNGKNICVTENTTTQKNIEEYITTQNFNSTIIFVNGDQFFRSNVCDAYTADRMNLLINLANRTDRQEDYSVLPMTFSREPIGPTVRDDDPQWEKIIRSVVQATILAEEKGITSSNVDLIRKTSKNIEINNLLGNSGSIGVQLGLDPDWAYRVIKAVGNYEEIFNRYFGPGTPVDTKRGLNALWSDGGILFAPPFK